MVASRSTVTKAPSAPGASCPASAQARSRAAARADRTALSARGRSAASWLTSRDTTGSDATGPASSGCSRRTAMSARQSPPRATAAARVRDDLARVVHRPRRRHRLRFCDRPRPRPVTRIVSHSKTAPAWDTRPRPSADTITRAVRALLFTWKVLSARYGQDLRQAQLSQVRALFYLNCRSMPTRDESPRLVPLVDMAMVFSTTSQSEDADRAFTCLSAFRKSSKSLCFCDQAAPGPGARGSIHAGLEVSGCGGDQRRARRAMSSPTGSRPTRTRITEAQTLSGGPATTVRLSRARRSSIGV
jgi:hypothetical protein